jgi:flagellar P-ring protein precursor FlgI
MAQARQPGEHLHIGGLRRASVMREGAGVRAVCALMLAAILLMFGTRDAFAGTTVKELARIEGQGESILRGVGLVVGLNGTGDSGKELAVARPLARLLQQSGNQLDSPLELTNSKSVALVVITCVIPETGARMDDRFDVTVSVVNSATSLEGGELYLAPLTGPFPGDPVYALAAGKVELLSAKTPTSGRVRLAARMVQDVMMPEVGDEFNLILRTPFAGWGSASQVATAINAKAQPQGPSVATVVDERTVRVTVPAAERADRAGFLADVLGAEVNPALLDLPARVIVNTASGTIIVTGDVRISPVAFTTKDLSLTTTRPAPVPTAQNPIVERDRWGQLATAARPSEQSSLSDLLAAFKQLDIPVAEQINLLQMLHKTGKLHAELVID